jgi:hypothetical protein
MPLINLKTSLKSLKFGSDRLGNGWSGQPYEQFPIPDLGTASPTALAFYNNNINGLDYPIRGGLINGQTALLNGQIDKDRIKKFFNDKPRGSAFLQKQIGLQLSNPKMQTGQSIGGLSGLNSLLGGILNLDVIENTRVYNNGQNTLAQVLASGTGTHIPRHGAFPIDTFSKYYMNIVGAEKLLNSNDVQNTNRLLILAKLKLQKPGDIQNINTVNRLGISLNNNLLFQYLGGPGSVYGVGSTTIKRSTNTKEAYDLTTNPKTKDLFPNVFAMSYDQILDQQPNRSRYSRDTNTFFPDFRSVIIPGHQSNYYDNGVDFNFFAKGVDKLNKSNKFKLTDKDPYTNLTDNKDVIKFGFECMSNDYPGESVPLIFRAFLTSGISDSNTGEWNSFKYMGRGETFKTYQGFQRSISFGFRVVAFSEAEMLPLYDKLNYLVSQVYPDYSASGFMRAPLVKLTLGDYLYRMPGVLTSVNLTVDNNTPWEIKGTRTNGGQLPKMIDVSVGFDPIFSELPRRWVPGEKDLFPNADNEKTVGTAIIGNKDYVSAKSNNALRPPPLTPQQEKAATELQKNYTKGKNMFKNTIDLNNLPKIKV